MKRVAVRATVVPAAVVGLVLVLFAVGCGGGPGDDVKTAEEIRAELDSTGSFVTEGGNYDTGHKLPDPPGSQGPAEAALGRLSLSFHDGKIREQVSDYWNEWTYDVDADGTIRAYDRKGNLAMTGEYDTNTGRLWWNGRWYVHPWTLDSR